MPGLYDTYVLSSERSATVLENFLTRFAPLREASSLDFTIQDGPHEQTYDSVTHALAYCLMHPTASASVYWRSLQPPAHHAIAFFTADGGLILGVSTCETDAPPTLTALRAFAGGHAPGYTCFEQPPPCTIAEFRAHAQTHRA